MTVRKLELTMARLCAFVACAMIVGMTALIVVELILRGLFGRSTYIVGEYVGYMLAICIVYSMTDALSRNTHVQIRFLVDRLGPISQRVLASLAVSTTLLVMLLVTWYFYNYTGRLWMRGTTSVTVAETPIWIPSALLTLGLGLLCVQLLLYGIRVAFGDSDAEAKAAPNTMEHI